MESEFQGMFKSGKPGSPSAWAFRQWLYLVLANREGTLSRAQGRTQSLITPQEQAPYAYFVCWNRELGHMLNTRGCYLGAKGQRPSCLGLSSFCIKSARVKHYLDMAAESRATIPLIMKTRT